MMLKEYFEIMLLNNFEMIRQKHLGLGVLPEMGKFGFLLWLQQQQFLFH